MERIPESRLGMSNSPHGPIRHHRIFRVGAIDWQRLELRQLQPPFKPSVRGTDDVQNFDTDFTLEPPELTPCDTQLLQTMQQDLFAGFSFTNPIAVANIR